MKAYIATTGIIFALLTLAHIARSVELWHRLGSDPWYVIFIWVITLLSGALSIWAWRLFRLAS